MPFVKEHNAFTYQKNEKMLIGHKECLVGEDGYSKVIYEKGKE